LYLKWYVEVLGSTNKSEIQQEEMKGSFWNSGGFRDTAKHNFVNETIRDHKLDFFAILESGKGNFSAPFLQHISGGLDFQ
jgi:hypothetical protein